MNRFFRSPLFVAFFIFLIGAVQVIAFETQFAKGFLPFTHEPGRVPFSWDMFANRVERCTLNWVPALKLGRHLLGDLRDVEVPFEWDVTFDNAIDYRRTGEWLCQVGGVGPTEASLSCFIQNGTEFHDNFRCK